MVSGELSSAEVGKFFEILSSLNPDPRGELHYTNEYTLLVAVVLSAQATDIGVNRATGPLFERVSTPSEMLDLGESGLRDYIKSIGLFRSKARHVIGLSEILLRDYGGIVPGDRDALETLPGVGRKTANVVMNMAFGEARIAVDTHIFRVSNRTGLALGSTPLLVEEGLERRIGERWKLRAHHWLILHGRYICKARKPLCGECPVDDLCLFGDKVNFKD